MKVLVVTGSSAGHIFPALSFLDSLKCKYRETETLLVIPSRSLNVSIQAGDYKIRYLSIIPIKFNFNLANLIAWLKFVKGWWESLILLLEFRPDIVAGFGGIDTVPLVLLAWMFRIKTLIHEQNVIPGRANRLLSRFADRIAVSFPETKDYLKISKKRIMLTGNPLRQELKRMDRFKALSFFGFSQDRFTILVMGGSLGSHRINMSFLGALSTMPDTSFLQVIHIAGPKEYSLLANSYRDLEVNPASMHKGGVKIKLFDFLTQMRYAYSVCDLVVCRAGATTISELMEFCLPAVIAPYPFAYKHQLNNAKVLENMGVAVVVNDNELDADRLRQILNDLIVNNPEELELMRRHYDRVQRPNANELLVDALVSLE